MLTLTPTSVEIQIPVPWGIIAGKSWGNEKNPLILAFHGFQDNANSFDHLIPLLPQTFHYICVDLPCHGKSSHFQTKSLISSFDFILSIKLILDHFNRGRYTLLGHSFGGQIITFFTQLYPEYVDKLICLDSYYLWPIPPQLIVKNMRSILDKYEKLHNLSEETAPTYTFDEAVQRVMAARVVEISETGARAIISRSLIPVHGDSDRYRITTSQQLKYIIRPPFSTKYQVELLKENPIHCPFLIIAASADTSKRFRSFVLPVLEKFEENPKYSMRVVEGSHDVHIDHPDRVAPLITDFLFQSYNNNNCKL